MSGVSEQIYAISNERRIATGHRSPVRGGSKGPASRGIILPPILTSKNSMRCFARSSFSALTLFSPTQASPSNCPSPVLSKCAAAEVGSGRY